MCTDWPSSCSLRRDETAGCCDNQPLPPGAVLRCWFDSHESLAPIKSLAQDCATRCCHQYLRSRALAAIGSGAMREVLVALAHPYQAPHSSHVFAKLALLQHTQLSEPFIVAARVVHLIAIQPQDRVSRVLQVA